jgi:membrane protease YdiL (CAAX protease family)
MPGIKRELASPFGSNGLLGRRQTAAWRVIAALEVVVAAAVVISDFFIATLIVLPLVVISLAIRRQGPSALGFRRTPRALRMIAIVFGLTLAWDLFQFGLTMPILNRITGERQDLSQFAGLQGNLGSLLIFLAVSWTLAAVGEEIVYRGYLPLRITDVFGANTVGILAAVVLSSVLFGLAHTEQGLIGIILTFLDALFFSFLRWRFKNLWAAVLGHGFNNTIGLVSFYLVGPMYGLW